MMLQKLFIPNTHFEQYQPKGLNNDTKYLFYNRELTFNIKEFGGLVNQVAPIHIKMNSLLHEMIAKFVKMPGEKECCISSGKLLMESGVKLKQGFGGTGYTQEIRFSQDFSSRMYFMEMVEEEING